MVELGVQVMETGDIEQFDTLLIEKKTDGFYVHTQNFKILAGPLPSKFSAQKYILKHGHLTGEK